jgi:hypothetical protein
MKIKIAIVASLDGHVTCVGPDDFGKDDYPDPMSAAVCFHIESGHVPVHRCWATVDLPEPSDIPVLESRVEPAP